MPMRNPYQRQALLDQMQSNRVRSRGVDDTTDVSADTPDPGPRVTPPDNLDPSPVPPADAPPSPGGGYTPPDAPPTFPSPSPGGGYTPPNYTPPTFPTDPGTGLPRVTYPTPTINPGITTQPPTVYRTMTEPRPAQGESGPGLGPGAPAQTQTMPAGYSQAFHDALVAAYQQYLGRTPSEDELVPHYSNPGGFNGALQTIMNSPEAYAYAHRPPTTTGTNTSSTTSAFDPKSWVDQQLSTAQSTDDPSYWYNKIANDANVQNASTRDSALAYWADRIARGDGALAVRNGTTAKYSEGPSGGGSQGNTAYDQYYQALLAQLQQEQQQQQAVQQAMRDALMNLMAQGEAPVDVTNDATLGPASAAYASARQRGANQTRAAVAERLAAEGLNSGGAGSGTFDSAVTGINENAAQDIAGNNAQLAQTELQNRRNLLVQAVQIAQALGARTEANQLSAALAGLDAQLRQQSLVQQQGQFEDTTAFNYAQLKALLDRYSVLGAMG